MEGIVQEGQKGSKVLISDRFWIEQPLSCFISLANNAIFPAFAHQKSHF